MQLDDHGVVARRDIRQSLPTRTLLLKAEHEAADTLCAREGTHAAPQDLGLGEAGFRGKASLERGVVRSQIDLYRLTDGAWTIGAWRPASVLLHAIRAVHRLLDWSVVPHGHPAPREVRQSGSRELGPVH